MSNMGVDEILGDKRQAILDLAEHYGIYNVRVFGSVARGEAGPDSDVDFLVEVRPGVGIRYFGFWEHLKRVVGRDIDLLTEDALDERMRQRIMPDVTAL